MLAQRYPTAYDGIAAIAPAIDWPQFLVGALWPQHLMNQMGHYPYRCEIDAITSAAIDACDGLDGVMDGIIAEVDECVATFDASRLIGTTVENCAEAGGSSVAISKAATVVVNAAWHGIETAAGNQTWHGYSPGTDLTGNIVGRARDNVAATNCTDGDCVGAPGHLAIEWVQMFVRKDPNFDFSKLTREEFDNLLHIGTRDYGSMVTTDDPDLSEFRNAGGKLVSFHGLVSPLILSSRLLYTERQPPRKY
jgi:hypothetical protein